MAHGTDPVRRLPWLPEIPSCHSNSESRLHTSAPPPARVPRPQSTILIVDDERMVRLVVRRLLEEWDFEVLEADNGRTALEVARDFKGALSLVITDLVMPYMDGCEFAEAFRALHPEVPVLFMTGKCPNAVVGSFFDPAENLITKPFDPDTFLDRVARLLESHINQRRVTA